MISPEIAQKIVDATMELIGNHSVNVMNQHGVILASGEKNRVGDCHKGALDAIRLGRTVEISADQSWRYPGSKAGVNMPIVIGGETLGAVGIAGDPQEVRGIANLVRVCVQLTIEQALNTQKVHVERELRIKLIHRLIRHPKELTPQEMSEECLLLNLDPMIARRAVVIALAEVPKETSALVETFEKIEKYLLRQRLVMPGEDLYGMIHQEYVVFRGWRQGQELADNGYLERIRKVLQEQLGLEAKIAYGGVYDPQNGAMSYAWSYEEASRLCAMYPIGCYNLESLSARVDSLIWSIPPSETARLLGEIRLKLFGKGQGEEWVLETIEAYFSNNMNIQRAAEAIHIHKNTMVYRMKRLTELAGLEEESRFQRDFILYLLLNGRKGDSI